MNKYTASFLLPFFLGCKGGRGVSSLLYFVSPAVDAVAVAAEGDVEADVAHAGGVSEEGVGDHAAGVGPTVRREREHRIEKLGDLLGVLGREVVFLEQHVRQGPVAQPRDVAQLAFAVEDLLRPLARDAERLGEGSQQLDDLRNVVVVLAVLGA